MTTCETDAANVETHIAIHDEIVRIAKMPMPQRRLVREDPDDPFTAFGREYMRFAGTGYAFLPREDGAMELAWKADRSLSLDDCNEGLRRVLEHLDGLDSEALLETAEGMSRAVAEQMFPPEWGHDGCV